MRYTTSTAGVQRVVLIFACFGLVCCGAGCSEPTPVSESTNSESTSAQITLQTVDKAGFDALLAKQSGKVVLVDCWATWCPPCREYFPHTVELSRKYGPRDFVVISVSFDDEDDSGVVLRFLREHEARFPNVRATGKSNEQIIEDFEIDGGALPHFKLYDRRGKLSKTFASDPEKDEQFTLQDVESAVAALLKQK